MSGNIYLQQYYIVCSPQSPFLPFNFCLQSGLITVPASTECSVRAESVPVFSKIPCPGDVTWDELLSPSVPEGYLPALLMGRIRDNQLPNPCSLLLVWRSFFAKGPYAVRKWKQGGKRAEQNIAGVLWCLQVEFELKGLKKIIKSSFPIGLHCWRSSEPCNAQQLPALRFLPWGPCLG